MSDRHEILPVRGSAVREGSDTPADLTSPGDYPVVATCVTCGHLVRCPRWYRGEWTHVTGSPR